DFLEALALKPDIDGVLLKTDLALKGNDARLEMLSDSVFSIKKMQEFENIEFTILSDYPEGHPLLSEFFNMGIYNFFSRGMNFNIDTLIRSFKEPMSFSMALKFRDPNPDIPWRKIPMNKQTFHVNFEK